MLKDRLTAKEFQNLMKKGVISAKGKRLSMTELTPEYQQLIEDAIWIPGEVYSSKNSKRIIPQFFPNKHQESNWKFRGRSCRPMIVDSAAVAKYKKEKLSLYKLQKDRFLNMIAGRDYPLQVEFSFVRKTQAIWDFNNMTELVQDMMKAAGWIPDDNIKIMIPVSGKHKVGKEPGVIIKVL